eukprot:CAMPEP_0113594954 /NCGR_PEP_ID=MMETSP0015_2-20120614/39377_1 /TAXON_ID=2838 /ORGANISM="Odontella" /LENGTH=208 /DNA_ID=CAMNT_0000502035 /DNA_START=12 /DNA_END=636 /DNA_ORIENTATION=- /assembly_acc=CAM_ASM_000160
MKLSSCFALFLILWTAEAAAPQGDKVNGNEKDRGNKVGNKGGGGQQKRAFGSILDQVHSTEIKIVQAVEMKLSSCFALFLILRTAEAAAPQGDKVNGNEKDRGNKAGNRGGGGQQKRAINGLLCASDGAASKECGSTDESVRKRCCDGLICNNDGQCADPCGPAVRECCDIKCDGMKRLKAESASAECCRIPLDAGTFPMIGECIKPG